MRFTSELLTDRISLVRERIERAAARSGRDPASIGIFP